MTSVVMARSTSSLYVNLGNGTVNCATAACLAEAIPVSVTLTENLFRAGINYKFNW
jgi:hypothetical protein